MERIATFLFWVLWKLPFEQPTSEGGHLRQGNYGEGISDAAHTRQDLFEASFGKFCKRRPPVSATLRMEVIHVVATWRNKAIDELR